MRELEHVGSGGRDERGKPREVAWPVGHRHSEHREPSVAHEPSGDDPLDHIDVDVSAREHPSPSRRFRQRAACER